MMKNKQLTVIALTLLSLCVMMFAGCTLEEDIEILRAKAAGNYTPNTPSSKTTYTVTFNANGGSGTVPSSQRVDSGSRITLPSGSGLSKTDYTFGGWNTNASGTGATFSAGSSYTVTSNVTLYAKWDSSSSGETVITLTYNEYWVEGSYWQHVYQSTSLLNGGRITAGDVYTFTYSFRSNVAIDRLQAVLVDTSPTVNYWKALSNYPWIQENIRANTVVSGSVTFIATGTATNTTAIANSLVFSAGSGTASSPTLTFTTFQFAKTGSNSSSIIDIQPYVGYPNILSAGAVHQYRFYATSGEYYVFWNDADNSYDYTADIQVGVKREGSTTYIVPVTDSGNIFEFDNAIVFTATPGNYIIEVRGYDSSSSGTYEIGYDFE